MSPDELESPALVDVSIQLCKLGAQSWKDEVALRQLHNMGNNVVCYCVISSGHQDYSLLRTLDMGSVIVLAC